MMTQPLENSVHPETRAEWRSWLQEIHNRDEVVWFISYKNHQGSPRLDAMADRHAFFLASDKPIEQINVALGVLAVTTGRA